MTSTNLRRRRFLQTTTGIAALAAISNMSVIRSSVAAALPRTFVCIHLSGGNDTLNTVVPYSDSLYYSTRGAMAVHRPDVLPLNSSQGLHPAMKGMADLFKASKMALINGVGYPRFEYSHFRATDILWQADLSRSQSTGWLGRAIDQSTAAQSTVDSLTGLQIGESVSPSLFATTFTAPLLPSVADQEWMPARTPAQRDALSAMLTRQGMTGNPLFDEVSRCSRATVDSYNVVQAAARLSAGAVYESSPLTGPLKFAAALIRQDPSVRIVSLGQAGYDTHANQLTPHAILLDQLSSGISSFMADLRQTGVSNRVAILLWSDFGRRVIPNANDGTDHGSAQTMFLIGDSVRPGIYGAPPSLRPDDLIDDGNLKMQVDFRSVYASILGWLGLNPAEVLQGNWPVLPILLA